MNNIMKYVGFDVSKEKIAVAIADEGRGEARYWGEIPNQIEEVRKLLKRLGNPGNLMVCYEAGPEGYVLYRQIKSLGIDCIVVAPSLIPRRPGNRIKTDRRDALRLAELFRAGELTEVWVPREEDEALRDLVRTREDAKEDLLRAKHRLIKFLARHDIKKPSNIRSWSEKYRTWIRGIRFEDRALQITFEEYRTTIEEIESRIQRLEGEIHRQAEESIHSPVIKALQTLRRIGEISATTIVAEVGCFSRFRNPSHFMGYAGVVPREYSSGEKVSRGRITRTGNQHLRRILIECSWSYRHKASMTNLIRKRQEGQPSSIQAKAWKAQVRLCGKYYRLVMGGKNSSLAVTAVARELLGFIWSIACEVEGKNVKELRAA